jgi:hypothetical protein
MKRFLFLLLGITILFSGCSVHSGLTSNVNNHTTEVVLSKKNFKVIESVQGEAQTMRVLGIGGLSRKAMIAEARANMLSKANIVGGSKAIINETVESKHSGFPIIVQFHTVTVSGHIVEFTE